MSDGTTIAKESHLCDGGVIYKVTSIKTKAFSKMLSKIRVEVPKKKLKSYKKILVGRGINKKAKFNK